MNSKRSLIDCGVFLSVCFYGVLVHTFAKLPQHQNIHNDDIDKKVHDPLSISRSKTSTVFLAAVLKQVDVSFQFHNE